MSKSKIRKEKPCRGTRSIIPMASLREPDRGLHFLGFWILPPMSPRPIASSHCPSTTPRLP